MNKIVYVSYLTGR